MKSRIDEFLAIEDQDLKSYIYSRKGGIYDEQLCYKIESDVKIAYYCKTEGVARNTAGAFYKKSKLDEWIVYDKVTKKAKVSNKVNNLRKHFLDDYLSSGVRDITGRFLGKLTATLCKKLIEGKIQTIEDLVSYHRSYTIRKKDVPLETVLRFMICSREPWLHVIEDPENVQTIKEMSEITSNSHIVTGIPFKFKVEDKDKIEEMYENWAKRQDIKYAALKRSGNADVGCADVSNYVAEASNDSY